MDRNKVISFGKELSMNGKKQLLVDSVYTSIKEGIIKGKYAAGLHLKESELMAEYEVSRVTVRDALRRLEMDELVVSQPNVGVTVRKYDAETFRNTMIVRADLEGLGARLCAERKDVDFSVLEDIIHEIEELGTEGLTLPDYEKRAELNHLFHKNMMVLSGNPVLYNTWERIDNYVHSFEYSLLMRPTSSATESSNASHRAILSAIQAHYGEIASKAAQEHVMGGLQYQEYFFQLRA